ncbi:MAG: carbohydrate porin, partial [Gammaproteobacteria bacterium]|nr:carbohydrate porin [Gammaproteobacteria bacterium]
MNKIFYRIITGLLLPFSVNSMEITTGQQSLQFHGYFRGGLGMSEHGSTQTKFQAPGARAKYRLGNEPETNMELKFVYSYDMKDPDSENANIQGVIMLDGFKNHGDSTDFTVDNLAQGYLSFNDLFDNGVKLWLGRRYYDRKSIHIMNHYWLNTGQNSHAGVGFEDLSSGDGKLNMAIFRHEDKDSNELINNTALDVRWHSLQLGHHSTLTVWGQLALRSEQPDLVNVKKESGLGLGFWIDHKAGKIKNTLALIHQTGASITQADFNPRPVRESDGWILDEAGILEINNSLTYESLPDFSYQWSVVLRQEDRGQSTNSKINWYSTGIRPVFYFSKHLNLALEAGIDYVDDEINNRNGSLSKLTTVLQVSADRGFKSRPVMRFFVTLADWSDEFIGLVGNIPGNAPYGNNSKGWTVGA